MKNYHNSFLILFVLFSIVFVQSCKKDVDEIVKTPGCTDYKAPNFNPEADTDDGTCLTWGEEMAGTYNAQRDCDLEELDSEFILDIVDLGDDRVSLTLNFLDTDFELFGEVDDDEIEIEEFVQEGIDFEIEGFSIEELTINGELDYLLEGQAIEGQIDIQIKVSEFIVIPQGCLITGTKQ